ncbi:hypothetical protein GPY57_11515 [Photorhabdus laumondii subsp. laumondii]|nr:hypothetical protein [Photorhabdus laumondii subsp. laumondii]
MWRIHSLAYWPIIVVYIRHLSSCLFVGCMLAALSHPGHIVIYTPGDLLPCRRDAS